MAIDSAMFLTAIDEIEASKGISKEVIVSALEEAMAKGLRKQIGRDDALIHSHIDLTTGSFELAQIKKVVKDDSDEDFDDDLEITVKDAKKLSGKKYEVGDDFLIPANIDELRKVVVSSVKSVLKQKFSEAEKEVLYETFKDKIDTMVTGKVEKVEERGLSVNIGKTSVYLPRNQMIGDEKFQTGENIKIFVSSVENGPKGSHIMVTRSGEGFLRCLFSEEIHEVYSGTIVIKNLVREAGERSKVAVYTEDPNVDPAGACIGPNGSRIQKIVGQLGNGANKEKIDIIAYSDVPGLYICEALKPAHVVGIVLAEEGKAATAIVKDDSLSLAIGRKGVNVRLAAKLTGYKIDIKTESAALEEGLEFVSYEALAAEDLELRQKKQMEARATKVEESKVTSVLPGLPEGYVAPQARSYDDNVNEDLDEALLEASEKEEISESAPAVKEEKAIAPVEVKKEETPVAEEHKKVVTTTSLEDLEKSLDEESARNKQKTTRKSYKNKHKEDEEEEESAPSVSTVSGPRMSIYTEEELRQMEEEDKAAEEETEEDDVDYDDYDEYYDDNK